MNRSQLTVCGICKQEIEKSIQEDRIIHCSECEAPYHKSHLKIWLRIETNCPMCRQNIQKLAFVNFSILHEHLDVSGDLYHQLQEIFPRGIPKPIYEKFINEFPNGIPSQDFYKLKELHSLRKVSKNDQIQERKAKELQESIDKTSEWIAIFGIKLVLALFIFIRSFIFISPNISDLTSNLFIDKRLIAVFSFVIATMVPYITFKLWNKFEAD